MTAPIRPRRSLDEIMAEVDAELSDPLRPTTPVARRDATQTRATTRNASPEDVARNNESWKGAGRTLAQGATARFGDEIEAAVRAPFSDRTYSDIRDEARGSVKTFKENSPTASNLLELSGGLLTGGFAAKALGAATPALSATQAAKTAGQTGAIMGGAAGVGGGETMGERVMGGATGAALGGALGAAAGAGGYKVASKLAERGRPREDKIILKAFDQDKVTPTQLRGMLAQTPIDDNLSLADIAGDGTKRLAGTATLTPTEGGSALRTAMAARSQEAGDDFGNLLQSASGRSRENVNAAQATMKELRAQTSGPLFEAAAKSGPVADPRLSEILKVSPEAQQAYQRMTVAAQRNKLAVPSLDDAVNGTPIDARAAHWLKLEMDGIKNAAAKQARTADGGMTTTMAAQVKRDAKALRDVLADVIPDYKQGLQTYAKASGEIRAYKTALKGGKNIGDVEAIPQFTNAKAEDVESILKSFTPAERELYASGGVQNVLRNSEDATATANKITRLLANPTQRAKFRTLFPDGAAGDNAFAQFLQGAKVQSGMRSTETSVIGNSATAGRDAAREALRGDVGILEDAAQRGSLKQAGESRFWQAIAKRRLGKSSDAVAQKMTPQSKAQLDAMLEAYEKMLLLGNGSPSLRAFSRSGAALGTGSDVVRR